MILNSFLISLWNLLTECFIKLKGSNPTKFEINMNKNIQNDLVGKIAYAVIFISASYICYVCWKRQNEKKYVALKLLKTIKKKSKKWSVV